MASNMYFDSYQGTYVVGDPVAASESQRAAGETYCMMMKEGSCIFLRVITWIGPSIATLGYLRTQCCDSDGRVSRDSTAIALFTTTIVLNILSLAYDGWRMKRDWNNPQKRTCKLIMTGSILSIAVTSLLYGMMTK